MRDSHRGTSINVLGSGFVRLVDAMGGDLSIVRAARVSYNADWRAGEDEGSDKRLIRSLMRRGHTSPFESVVLTFEVKCPLFVARQWHCHRTWAYNEISARYAELDEGYYVPDPSVIGVQSTDNKQVRDIDPDAPVSAINRRVHEAMADFGANAFALYQEFLQLGVPRELARSVLPVSSFTRFFGTVSLHNLFRFIELRVHPHAQYESQQYGHALIRLARYVAPLAVDAFAEYRLRNKED